MCEEKMVSGVVRPSIIRSFTFCEVTAYDISKLPIYEFNISEFPTDKASHFYNVKLFKIFNEMRVHCDNGLENVTAIKVVLFLGCDYLRNNLSCIIEHDS